MPSRAETQSKIDAVRKKIESLQTEACAVEVAMELRRAQTTLLFSVLRDLQQSIQVGCGCGRASPGVGSRRGSRRVLRGLAGTAGLGSGLG